MQIAQDLQLALLQQWVWVSEFRPLACKAHLFKMLEMPPGGGRQWPETWVLPSIEALTEWHAAAEEDRMVPCFVKHPRTGGGRGTFPSVSPEVAYAHASMVLKVALDAVVIQRAVVSATLPRGPSIFELRVWALFRQSECWLFEHHRAKTAISGLMSRQAQKELGAFGRFYADNIASETDVRSALEEGNYDMRTKPNIATAVALVHRLVHGKLPAGLFAFVGFDFIVDESARPWLIEANVKPATRYVDITAQFPSPIVSELASCAVEGLVSEPDNMRPFVGWVKLSTK